MNRAKTLPLVGLLSALLYLGCDTDKATKQTGKNGENISLANGPGFLKLSWAGAKTPVSSYHIFYTQTAQTNKKGKEIDSLIKGKTKGVDFNAPSIILGKTNIDPFPPLGTKVCFYLEAKQNDVRSDPSASVCGVLE
jgi:hypothetical protein